MPVYAEQHREAKTMPKTKTPTQKQRSHTSTLMFLVIILATGCSEGSNQIFSTVPHTIPTISIPDQPISDYVKVDIVAIGGPTVLVIKDNEAIKCVGFNSSPQNPIPNKNPETGHYCGFVYHDRGDYGVFDKKDEPVFIYN